MRLEPNQRWFSHSISFHVNMRFCLHLVTCEIKAKYSVFILELNSFYGLFSAPPPLETWIINFIIIAILLICIELWIKKLLFFPREISRSNCWFVNLRVNEKVPPRYSSFLFSWEKKGKIIHTNCASYIVSLYLERLLASVKEEHYCKKRMSSERKTVWGVCSWDYRNICFQNNSYLSFTYPLFIIVNSCYIIYTLFWNLNLENK